MDAVGLDVMHEEYQEKREEAAMVIQGFNSEPSQPATVPEPQSSPQNEPSDPTIDINTSSSSDSHSGSPSYSGLVSEETVPVSDDDGSIAHKKTSTDSSSNEPLNMLSSTGSNSLYQAGFTVPSITYERDNEQQKLVAVIGREFDCPREIASTLQRLVFLKLTGTQFSVAKFVPFTVKRKMLLKGTFDNKELRKHDLICMCYNASEARLLLTGVDGFYTSLLSNIESTLGSNKVAFLISNYTPPQSNNVFVGLIYQALKTRLYNQEPLRQYLDQGQVLSWSDQPSEVQARKLVYLANLDFNPPSLMDTNCLVL